MTATPDEKESVDFARVPKVEKPWSASCSHALHPPTIPVRPAPILSVVIPTFNESSNVAIVIERVAAALAKADWEIIFVDDDSPDSTSTVAKGLGERDGRVRCIRRVGRRGLAGACIEGALSSQARYVAVMDADLQHDERLLPRMLRLLGQDQADLVIASRYMAGGATTGLSSSRRSISRVATRWAQKLMGIKVHDPMSGFFMARRDLLDTIAPELSNEGFKILFDILVASRRGQLKIVELPYAFLPRLHGGSKFDARNAIEFFTLVMSRLSCGRLPPQFFSFLLVGGTGVGVQLACLAVALAAGLGFLAAEIVATLAAMTSNFFLNNALTYNDRRVAGRHLLPALFRFYAVCSVGALSNVGTSSWLYAQYPVWWLAGLTGSVIAALWNFIGSSKFVWSRA
jgi:dolichol-phosphate mannosyltransferase